MTVPADRVLVFLRAYRDNTVTTDDRGQMWGTAALAVVAKRLGVRVSSPELALALHTLHGHGSVARVENGQVVFRVV